jgi:putative Holliday junction resolvase
VKGYENSMNFTNFPRFKEFYQRNILAIDYGTKRVGTALFCPGRDPYPYPLGKILYKDDPTTIQEIQKIIEEEAVEVLVIGIPYFTDGKASQMTEQVLAFKNLLEKEIELPIYQQDETLSSFEAEDRMKNSPRYNFKVDPEMVDALAASIILEDFIKFHS